MSKVLLSINDPGLRYSSLFARMIDDITDITEDVSILDENPERIAMLCFTGGSDVDPNFYNERVGSYTFFDTSRDIFEQRVFEMASAKNIPMVGICRGSQFLNVMCGGKLIQNTTGHAGTIHNTRTYDGKTILVNSTHHQMSVPTDDALLLAWAEPKISDYYLDGDNLPIKEPVIEVESFCYPDKKVIGWQYHPEMITTAQLKARPEMQPCIDFVYKTLTTFVLNSNEEDKNVSK